MIVIADTGPLNYLLLIGQVGILRELYGSLTLPTAVHVELLHPKAPLIVRSWAANIPEWVEVSTPGLALSFPELGPGEREAIALGLELGARLIVMDDAAGRTAAVSSGLPVKGLIGILEEAASRDLLDLRDAIARLKQTNIFLPDHLVRRVLKRYQV